jgi:two-component system LytT family response regulator
VIKQNKAAQIQEIDNKLEFERLKQQVEILNQSILIQPTNQIGLLQKIHVVEAISQLHFLPVTEIIYLKSNKNYTHIVCKNQKVLLSTKTIKYHEAKLTSILFFRIHHGFLINLHHLTSIKKQSDLIACMSNGDSIPISARKKKDVLNLIEESNLVLKKSLI